MSTTLESTRNWVRNRYSNIEKRISKRGFDVFKGLRSTALDAFSISGIPSTRLEEWKYSHIAPQLSHGFGTDEAAETLPKAENIPAPLCRNIHIRMVFVDGKFYAPNSSGLDLPPGVTLISLSRFSDDDKAVEGIGTLADFKAEDQSLVALNTACADDGFVLHIQDGVVLDSPIEVVWCVTSDQATAYFPRMYVVLGRSSKASLVEDFVGIGSAKYFSCAVGEISLAAHSEFSYCRVQRESAYSTIVNSLSVKQDEESVFRSTVLSLGGGFVRNEIRVTLAGERCHSTLNGINLLNTEQHLDNHTVIDHVKPNCESSELYKGVYADKSYGIFSGTIVVREDAQKTNAFQSNQSILLSDSAKSHSRPQLKIWADDVKCSHGATVGQLDDDALFYLRSRGIPKLLAQSMLVRAFLQDVLEGVGEVDLSESLAKLLEEKFKKLLK